MKIAFYNTKPYDKIWFEPLSKDYGCEINFIELPCSEQTSSLAKGHDLVCAFVNDQITPVMIDEFYSLGIKAILLRSAGFNNVDIKAAEGKMPILRVPSYSPESVAEFAASLLLTVNRHTHRAYARTRDFNMNINGFTGRNLYKKVAGIIGTGKIGQAMVNICKGFGMEIIAFDPYPNRELDVRYVTFEELVATADVISLHCPLTPDTAHMINRDTIALMKKDVYLINTSRGGLIDTESLIEALLAGKFSGVGLDVYEEEEGVFFEDKSNEIIEDEQLVRLTSFHNVLITSHMGFFTHEAMREIATTTLENAVAVINGEPLINEVKMEGKNA
ncbi:MAG: 2-hydroxyacid dehydrogenase [Lachnospiraceae bacterium]|nr:2-hydroxyacid dehydrogenase [Lachnospiraceae bacterium]